MIFRKDRTDLYRTAHRFTGLLISGLGIFLLSALLPLSNSALAQSAPYRISGGFGDFQDVTEFKISPDGAWTVFIADKNIDNNFVFKL